MVDAGRVLTNAHVVAGAATVVVDGRAGAVVAFDPNRDLALVAAEGIDGDGVAVAEAEAGTDGTLVAIDATGSVVRHPYEVRRRIRATGEDIYRDPGADRRALEVEVEFAPGWSGSGLFDDRGRLVGVVFAESRRTRGVAYAVADTEIVGFLADAGGAAVDPGPCP